MKGHHHSYLLHIDDMANSVVDQPIQGLKRHKPMKYESMKSRKHEQHQERLSPTTSNDLSEKFKQEDSEINMDLKYKTFKEKINRLKSLPTYLQGTYKNNKRKKIVINVEKAHVEEANKYFEKNDFCDRSLLQIVGQEPILNAMKSPAENALIQAGISIMRFTESADYTLEKVIEREISLNDVKRKYYNAPAGTLGGFVSDDEGNVYLLTDRHILKGSFNDEMVESLPGTENCEKLHVISEIFPSNSTDTSDGKGKLFHIGSEYYGSEGISSIDGCLRGMDFALVKITKEIKNSDLVEFNYHIKNKKIEVTLYSDKNEEMYGKNVQKDGITTGVTKGIILPISQDIKFKSDDLTEKLCEDTFFIQSPNEKFADSGDSGSLVVAQLSRNKGKAIGLVHAITKKLVYHGDETTKTYKNVCFCLRLDHCFEFAKSNWQIEGLKFIN